MTLKKDYSCGVIPVRLVNGKRQYLLVQHQAGHWSFPKGHPEGEESPIETATRELLEETGLSPRRLIESPAFEEAYVFTKRSGKVVEKNVTYFVGEVGGDAVRIQLEEVSDFAWGDSDQTSARLTFDEGRVLLDEVERYLDEDERF